MQWYNLAYKQSRIFQLTHSAGHSIGSHSLGSTYSVLECRYGTSSKSGQYEHFFRFERGRWLWDEETQLRQRYRTFNIEGLKNVAAASVGAKTCVSITKLAEGGFNKVFRLQMNDGQSVIGRIPNPIVGPAARIVSSEVATMAFARDILGIPVPKVHDWSSSVDNAVGTEYIVMEEAPGTQLADVWDDMDIGEKIAMVNQLIKVETKMLAAPLTRYGNLYFAEDSFEGCQPAELAINEATDESRRLSERFLVGPVIKRDFWHEERASMGIDRGPWKTPQAYLEAIAKREITWLRDFAASDARESGFTAPGTQTKAGQTREDHVKLYKMFQNIIPNYFPSESKLSQSTIWHWDLNSQNIFVKDGTVSSIIDWQDSWAGPLVLQARHPQAIRYGGEMQLKLPDNFKQIKDQSEKERIESKVERSILRFVYETNTRNENALLDQIYNLPQYQNRKWLYDHCEDTWDGDFIAFRQCLIRMERYWDEIAPGTECPIHFSQDELEQNVRDGEAYNDTEDFWDSIDDFVRRDGYVSPEQYEEALAFFADLRQKGLEVLEGDEKIAFEAQTRWAVMPPKHTQ